MFEDPAGGDDWDLADCPVRFAGEETFNLIGMADLFRKGLAPVAGGTLDQAESFLQAARFVWAEQDRNEAELKLKSLKKV